MEEMFESKRPDYPWQIEPIPWAPKAKMTEAERRADFTRFMFEQERAWREEGMGGYPDLFYDEGRGFFRFSDVAFALSRTHANWSVLKEKGFFSKWEV